jgi:hypothetical protein
VSTAILLWVVYQVGSTPQAHSSHLNASATINIPAFAEESPADLAADEERDFILRLNGVSRALNAFVDDYKSGQVDVKKVKALRKAMHELEKTEWFRPPKAK